MGENDEGFRQLTEKIGNLVPIISHMRKDEKATELTCAFLQSLAKWVLIADLPLPLILSITDS
jgi:hypothetical protein